MENPIEIRRGPGISLHWRDQRRPNKAQVFEELADFLLPQSDFSARRSAFDRHGVFRPIRSLCESGTRSESKSVGLDGWRTTVVVVERPSMTKAYVFPRATSYEQRRVAKLPFSWAI